MAYTDLFLDAGSDFSSSLDLIADDGTAINITNYVFRSQMRKGYYSTNVTSNLVVTIVDGPSGNATISLDAANTTNIAPGRYVYDVYMKDSSNVNSRIVEGIITVTPQVSK